MTEDAIREIANQSYLSKSEMREALRAVERAGYAVISQEALDLALSRGCDHCAESIRSARGLIRASQGGEGDTR